MRRVPVRSSRQRGLSSLLVIAVLVILGAASAYAVGLVTSSHAGQARELSHARAVQAARAGLDWARFRVQVPAAPQCAAAQTLAALPGTLAAYPVTVRCTAAAPVQEGASAVRAYRVVATACSQALAGQCPHPAPGPDYVEHTIGATLLR